MFSLVLLVLSLLAVSVKNALNVPYRIIGNQKETVYDVTCDNSYTEGGEALTPAELGLNTIERSTCSILNGSEAEADPVSGASYDGKLLHLINGKTSKEIAKEKDMSKVIVRVTSRGT